MKEEEWRAREKQGKRNKYIYHTLVGVMSSTDTGTGTGASMTTDTKRGGGEKETGTGRAAVIDAMLKRKMCL